MDFGRVDSSKLDAINFKLPKEPYTNSKVLKGYKSLHPAFYVGLARWGEKEWIGRLYPAGTSEARFQQQYQKQFNAIELDSTHYKLPSDQVIGRWLENADGSSFIFCPKFYQGITHSGSLIDKQFLTDVFVTSLRKLGGHLGPTFIQLTDKFGPGRKEELFAYLTMLPKDLSFFLELRDPDWFEPSQINELISMLQKLKIGFVITDTAGRREVVHMNLAVPKSMIRFVANDMHPTDFLRLDEWISRIRYWVDSGLKELYFFIHSLNEKFAPDLAQYLIRGLNEQCDAGLREIRFFSQA